MRVIAKVLAVLVALPAIGLLLLVAINWRDQPPSADAERFDAMLRDRPALADAENAYVHVMRLVGPGDPAYRDARSADVDALSAACQEVTACADALEEHPDVLSGWLSSEHWLLDRYRGMLHASQGWREPVPADLDAMFPSFGPARDAQKLHLLDAWTRARAGDAGAVRDMLDRDLRFWRRVVASSDLLISKMVAADAVERNFEWGAMALRSLPADAVDGAVPPSWREPMTLSERSLTRALGGEWSFMASAVRSALVVPGEGEDAGFLSTPLHRVLFQEQATRNLFAANLAEMGQVSERPYPELRDALDAVATGERGGTKTWLRAYNPVGAVLAAISPPAYVDYVARAADLEGRRRVALLAATLHATGTPPAGVAQALAETPLRSPYDDTAFSWDVAEGRLVFQGLRSGEKGRYAIALYPEP